MPIAFSVDGLHAGTQDTRATPGSFLSLAQSEGLHASRRNGTMFSDRRRLLPLLISLIAPITLYAQTAVRGGCGEIPREDALPFLCAPPTSEILAHEEPDSVILLNVPAGTTLRVAVDETLPLANPRPAVS